MAYSSILGAEQAPSQPSGRDTELLGPSDTSDTGSDVVGTQGLHADSDSAGTGERGSVTPGDAVEGADILPDRIVRPGADGEFEDAEGADDALASGEGFPAADIDAQELTDLDADSDADRDDE